MAKVNLIYDELKQLLNEPKSIPLGLECNTVADVIRLFIDGEIDVLESHDGTTIPYFLFESLFGELDAGIRTEIVIVFRRLVQTVLSATHAPERIDSAKTLSRVFSAGLFLLTGRPERLPLARLAKEILEERTWPIIVREQAAYYLSSIARPEDTSEFWKGLLSGEEAELAVLIPTVFSVLILKDSNSALQVVAEVSNKGTACDTFAANAVIFFGEALCNKIGDFRTKRIAEAHYPQMGTLLRSAIDHLRDSKWANVSQTEDSPETPNYEIALPADPSSVTRLAMVFMQHRGSVAQAILLRILLVDVAVPLTPPIRATRVRNAAKKWNAALRLHERNTQPPEVPIEQNVISLNRGAQLAIISEYAAYESRACEAQLGGETPRKVLMDHLQDRWKREGRGELANSYATDVRNELVRVDHDGWLPPLKLGSSEFHQDRIIFALVCEVLESQGVWTRVESIPWAPEEQKYYDERIDIRFGAKPTDQETGSGVFEFRLFRAFARTDHVLRLSSQTDKVSPIQDACNQVLSALRDDKLYSIPTSIRALVAASLMPEDYIGDAFDLVASAIDTLAGAKRHRDRVYDSNDKRFEAFVLGGAGIYCGGAINQFLLEKWWANREWAPDGDLPEIFELLRSDEILEGMKLFTLKRRKKLGTDTKIMIENYLHFGNRLKARRARGARMALVRLHRAVGIQLAEWAKEVCTASSVGQANGLAASMAASMHLLTDTVNKQQTRGHYSFVSSPTDAAELISAGERFYSYL